MSHHYVGVMKNYRRKVLRRKLTQQEEKQFLYVIGPVSPQKALSIKKRKLPKETAVLASIKE